MPGCVLRVASRTSQVDDLVRVSGLTPAAVFEKGHPKAAGSSLLSRTSGFNVVVSTRDGLGPQSRDAVRFLGHHARGLGRLRRHSAFRNMRLDFGLYDRRSRDLPWPTYRLPAHLVALAGQHDIELELSFYGPEQERFVASAIQSEAPRFLNIDLDVRSRYSLAALVAASPWSHQPRNAKNQPDPHWVILTPPGITHTSDGAARKLLAHIGSLRGEARRCWRRARLRVFDIGVQAGGADQVFEDVGLTAETLRQIALAGAQVKVTVYPAQPTSSQGLGDAGLMGSAPRTRKKQAGWTWRVGRR